MSNLLMFYIADILNECGMDKNPQAQDMLLREFTHIYKECLLKYDPEYAKKISEDSSDDSLNKSAGIVYSLDEEKEGRDELNFDRLDEIISRYNL